MAARGVAAGPLQRPMASSAPQPQEQWPWLFPSMAEAWPDHYLLCKAALPLSAKICSFPGQGHPVLLSLAPAQTLLWETARLPPKQKKRGRKPKFGFKAITALAGGHGLDHQHPQVQHRFSSLHPSAPLGFPTSGMLQRKAWEAQSFCPKGLMPKGTSHHLALGSQEASSEGLGGIWGWRGGHKGAADGIFEGDRVSPSQARWKRLLPSQGMHCCQSCGASEDLLARHGCTRSMLGHRPLPGLWWGDAVQQWHPAPAL